MNLVQLQCVIGITTSFCFWIAVNSAAYAAMTLDDLFPSDRVLDVQITVADKDWDTIRHQRRDFRSTLHESRREAPIDSPYTYVDASVTIDGVTFPEVGLRKKGFLGSLNSERPSLKIRLNHVDKNGGIEGLTNLTLNNNQQDAGLVSQFIGYALFNTAGSPAPRCAFASVNVNGKNLGVYSHVETIRRSLLDRAFGNSDGTLYEGPYVDFYEGWEGSFEHKTGDDSVGRARIGNLIRVLMGDDEGIDRAIGEYVHLDSFFTYWALEGLLGFWDGYSGNSNNYFFYLNPATDRFHFIPWGADSLFVKYSKLEHDRRAPISVKTQGLMTHKLYQLESARKRYAETLTAIMDKHWNEAELLAELDRIETMVTPHLIESQRFFYDDDKQEEGVYTYAQALDETRDFIRRRRTEIGKETADGMPEWRAAPKQLFVINDDDIFKPKPDSIWHALHTGNTAAIQRYVAKGADVNAKDGKFGVTPLTWAVLGRQIDAVELLVQKGADVNAGNEDGNTPLHTAAFLGEYEIAHLLIKNGADVNIMNQDGDAPMSSLEADWEFTEAIAGWLNIEVDRATVERGRAKLAGLLRKHGAQTANPNRDAICDAARTGNMEEIEAHLAAGGVVPDAGDRKFGVTPLCWAALGGHSGIVEFLIQQGASVDARNRDGATALHGAAFLGRVKTAELLLENGADPDVRNHRGETPMNGLNTDWETTQFLAGLLRVEVDRESVERGRHQVEAILRQHVAGSANHTIDELYGAARNGNIKAVKRYLADSVDINAGDTKYGVTPLCWAAFSGHAEIIELLIESGADVNAKNRDAGTALHGAAFLGQAEAAALLIQNGADTHAKHESGDTPMDSANVDWGTTQFVAGLLEIEIDREAVERGRERVVAILREHNAKRGRKE